MVSSDYTWSRGGYFKLSDGSGPYAIDGAGNARLSKSRNKLFGVNLGGPEYAPWNGQKWPTQADFNKLATLGVDVVRLPLAWEDLQATLGGPLTGATMLKVFDCIDWAYAAGIRLEIEIHNFGAYADQTRWTHVSGNVGYAGNGGQPATGVSFFGNGITTANVADLCTKFFGAVNGRPGFTKFGIMNEPSPNIRGKNLAFVPNYFIEEIGANWYDINGAVVSILGAGSNPLGSNYGPAWLFNAGQNFAGQMQPITFENVPMTLSYYAQALAGSVTGIMWSANTSANITVTTAWQRFTRAWTPPAGASSIGIGMTTAGQQMRIANIQLELGSVATAYEPNPAIPFLQAGIDAVRAINSTFPIIVSGFNSGMASRWQKDNFEYTLLTGGNIHVEPHVYFDGPQGRGGGGQYSGSFASYGINTNTGVEAVTPAVEWAEAFGKTMDFGEFGIPAGADAANWLATQQNTLAYLRAHGMGGKQWFYGVDGGQAANPLNTGAVANDPRLIQMLAA